MVKDGDQITRCFLNFLVLSSVPLCLLLRERWRLVRFARSNW